MSLSGLGAAAIGVVRDHQAWAAPICFALAFAESLAFVSLLVPATVALIAVGGLVPLARLSFTELLLAAALGAATGDWLSFWLGRRFGDRIERLWPFSRHPDMMPRAKRFASRWGWLGVCLGRFLGPLRATVPLAAGIAAMPFWAFQAANVASALLWAFALLAPGAFGIAWLTAIFQ